VNWLLVLVGFWLGFGIHRLGLWQGRRSVEERTPYAFTWTCPVCGGCVRVSCNAIEAIPDAEDGARRLHRCAS